jgi:hypothetical protein
MIIYSHLTETEKKMSEIHFSNPTTSPEAFSDEWQEWNQTVEASTAPEEPIERAPEDIIREWEEYYLGQDLPEMEE